MNKIMAGIDKIYGNEEQYRELVGFIGDHIFRIMVFTRVFFLYASYPYNCIYSWEYDKIPKDEIRVITNLPTVVDIYLMIFCKSKFVRGALEKQYGKINIRLVIRLWFQQRKMKLIFKDLFF